MIRSWYASRISISINRCMNARFGCVSGSAISGTLPGEYSVCSRNPFHRANDTHHSFQIQLKSKLLKCIANQSASLLVISTSIPFPILAYNFLTA